MQGSGYRVQGVGCRVQAARIRNVLRVEVSHELVPSVRERLVQGLGFRV